MYTIPSIQDWGDYKANFDSASAFDRFYGKSSEEVTRQFYQGVTEKYSELLFMPEKAFQYYIFALADFVIGGNFHPIYSRASTAAGCLFDIVMERVKIDYGSVAPIAGRLLEYLRAVADNPAQYGTDDDFQARYIEAKSLLSQQQRI